MNFNNSSVFIQVPFSSLDSTLERLMEERIQPEIGFTGPDLDRLDMDQLAVTGKRLADAGLKRTVHAPYNDLNPGSLEPLVVQATAERFLDTLECANHLGAHLVVVHPGYDPWRYGFHEELWLEKASQFWPPILKRAADLHLSVALENVFDRHPRPLLDLLQEFSAPGLGFCLDVGHYQLFRSTTLEDWVERMAPFLMHLHLHDNFGERDDHLPISQGLFDFAHLFSLLEDLEAVPSMTLENGSIDDALLSRRALRSFF
ncbi:MAG TPA: sugar phosphate isomerase/epimerase family protein [Desulfuromonadales bacterium]|nr:sugar phosphate isomerase/epimerase family protein [Desulfuromonadales bacterium]